MIQRQFGRRMLPAAVLTGGMIAQQNILARERSSLEGDVPILSQPNHRRCVNGQLRRMKHMAVVLFDSGDTLENHYHCAPFVAHIDRLKGCVQY